MTTDQIQDQLQSYYRRRFTQHPDARLSDLVAINEGWESIVYAFKIIADPKTGDQPQRMILRIYPGGDAYQKSGQEFSGLQTLFRAGYPVPQVFALECDDSPFEGRPFVLMEYIPGEMMWSALDHASPEDSVVLITRFCELFVQLHTLDWRAFIPAADHQRYQEPYTFIDGFLNQVGVTVEHFPELDDFFPVFDWLSARRDQVHCHQPAPIHWDFHPANLILKPDGTAVVIDWTQIQVSDPRFDLGWTLMLTGAYAGERMRDTILSEYQRISGVPVEELAWFEVANCLKRLGSVLISLLAGADSMGMRPDAVAMMRRDFPALRRVYDLMVDRTGIRISTVEGLLDSY